MRHRDGLAAIAAIGLSVVLFMTPAARWLDGLGTDLLFGARQLLQSGAAPESRDVVVVALDEETYRRPPFNAKPSAMWTPELAKVIEALLDAGVSVIGFDVVFSTSLESLLPGYERPYLLSLRRGARDGRIVLGRVQHQAKPIEPFAGQRFAVGHDRNIRLVNALEDSDGIIRRGPLAFTWREPDGTTRREASMAMELAARKAGSRPEWDAKGNLRFNGRAVRLAGDEAVQLNFDTRPGAVPLYSFADLHACAERGEGAYFAEHFRDKVVLVGAALDVEDRKLTSMRLATRPEGQTSSPRCVHPPMENLYDASLTRDSIPGVMLHATAVSNLLNGGELMPLGSAARIGLLSAISLAAAAAVLGLSAGRAAVAFLALSGIWVLSCIALFFAGTAAPLLNALGAAGLTFTLLLGYRFAVTDRDKRAIRRAFGLYLPTPVIDRMVAEDKPPVLGGEERVVTILFSDIAGFTRLSESLPPAELVRGLNTYFAAMTSLVEEHGGFVDKFVGDAIVAVFGAPVDDGKHAEHAVRAALHMDRVMQTGSLQLGSDVPIHIRIGINTGPVLIGNIGSPRRFNYTAMGDAVNLASRLEGANKTFATRILVSDTTRDACGDRIVFREIDQVRVVGRSTPVRLYEPIIRTGRKDSDPRIATLAPFAAAISLWRSGRFAEAEAAFAALAPDPAAAAFVQRCREMQDQPPASWNGVTDLTSK